MHLLRSFATCVLAGALAVLCGTGPAWAGTTGKVAGRVLDEGGAPLPGVQVVLGTTGQGTVTDADGYYQLLNVPPGRYAVSFRYIGFATITVEGVEVVVDQTTPLDVTMREEVIQGQEVIVRAERPLIEVSRTTTTSTVSEEELAVLPVTGLDEVINLQAGIVDGHFRGGRLGEVSYLVNGVPINNAFSNQAAFTVEQNMVSSLEVISGVFNAEYGQALSGVVNIVTKGVPSRWTASAEAYAGGIASARRLEYVERTVDNPDGMPLAVEEYVFLPNEGRVVTELGPNEYLPEHFTPVEVPYYEAAPRIGRQNVQLSIGGPMLRDRLGVRATGRYYASDGHQIARRLFVPSDSSRNLATGDQSRYLLESSGDGTFVPDREERWSMNTALTAELGRGVRLDYNAFLQRLRFRRYAHDFKYVPDGLNRDFGFSQTHIVGLRAALSATSFANLSYSFLRDEEESYLFDIPEDFEVTGVLDPRYVPARHNTLAGTAAFRVGGNDLFHERQLTRTHSIVADYTNQVNRIHQVKAGASARLHNILHGSFGIDNGPETNYQPRPSIDPYGRDTLRTRPYELAAYLQDKMEFEDLIVNAGLRFDYFEPDYLIPLDWAQGGQEQVPNVPGWAYYDPEVADSAMVSNRRPAPASWQLSPRIGVAFPISSTGVVRFSAGLFFQTPPFRLLYENPEYEVDRSADVNRLGNPAIDPERTLTFEVGLQQGLTESLGLELTLFSKDIRNLTGERFERMPNGNYIVRYINRDDGTIRGVTLSLFQRPGGALSWDMDYTLQFAEGTASRPDEAFARFLSGQEDILTLVRLDWDRRHVLNASFTYRPAEQLTLTVVNRLQTGRPYTTVRRFITSYVENNADRPTSFFTDLRLFWRPTFLPGGPQLFVQVDNLFDAAAHETVYETTGRADESVELEIFRASGTPVGGVNSLDEYYYRLGWFSPPRRVSVGVRVEL